MDYAISEGIVSHSDFVDDPINELKRAVNNILWMYGDGSLTIGEADERACRILEIIRKKPANTEEEE